MGFFFFLFYLHNMFYIVCGPHFTKCINEVVRLCILTKGINCCSSTFFYYFYFYFFAIPMWFIKAVIKIVLLLRMPKNINYMFNTFCFDLLVLCITKLALLLLELAGSNCESVFSCKSYFSCEGSSQHNNSKTKPFKNFLWTRSL